MKIKRMRAAWAAVVALAVLACAVGCKRDAQTVVGFCNGDPILREEYEYLAGNLTEGLTDEERIAQIEQAIKEDRAVLAAALDLLDGLNAESESVLDAVEEGVSAAIETYGGKSAYKSALKELGLTEHHFRRMLAISELQRLLQEKLFSGTELENDTRFAAWLKNSDHYARAERYCFDSAADAERFLAAVGTGIDADTACETYGGEKKKAGYFFLGLGSDSEDRSIFSLSADGASFSGAVEQSDGSAIVYRRLSVSEEEREDMAALQGKAVMERLREIRFAELLDEYGAELTVSWS